MHFSITAEVIAVANYFWSAETILIMVPHLRQYWSLFHTWGRQYWFLFHTC